MSRMTLQAKPPKKAILDLLPDQGLWTEEQYLCLTDGKNYGAEFIDGYLEILPMPTDRHQTILAFLFLAYHSFVTPRGGKVLFSGLRVRLRPGQIREPDLCVFLNAKDPRREDRFWSGADMVVEVVSKDDPTRDLVDKRREYAKAGIPEYWIANPLNETILVYQLKGKRYPKANVYRRGKIAHSHLLSGFSVNVSEVFDAD